MYVEEDWVNKPPPMDGRDEPGEVRHGNTVDPTVWSLFHGHPALERINESIQIGRVGAPDSALSVGQRG